MPRGGKKSNAGRKKGVPNKTTMQFKEGVNKMIEYATPQMVQWLSEIENPKDRMDLIYKFAQFGYPLLARTELTGDPDKPLHVNHVKRTIIDPDDKS